MGLFSRFKTSNTLYFLGCMTAFKFRENLELYEKIFSKLGIRFKIIDKKVCCGLPALEAGYDTQARKLARRNFEIFKEEGITEIITDSPCCYKMFLQNYPEFLPDWDIKIKNIWEIILEKLERKPRLIKDKAMQSITFHDSCYLGRYCKIYDAPRKILELLGYEIKEMPDSREESICCGGCGGLPRTNPELANKIAKERILQAKRLGIRKMIVSSLSDYKLLKKNSEDVKILTFSEVLGLGLGIILSDEEKLVEEEITKEEQIVLNAEANIQLEEELKEEEYYDDREG